MPKFKFAENTELVEVLQGMGLGAMFESGHGGLGGMIKGDCCVSDIKHRAAVNVDEDGTEASAATVVVVGRGFCMPEESVVMELDEPFCFWIVERNTRMVLFTGKVYDPVCE